MTIIAVNIQIYKYININIYILIRGYTVTFEYILICSLHFEFYWSSYNKNVKNISFENVTHIGK
jgi:hypothetical protein